MRHTDRAGRSAHCMGTAVIRIAMIAATLVAAEVAQAQQTNNHVDSGTALDSLIAQAISASPGIRVAQARVGAARARVSPAGTLPDPTLMLGVVNLPISHPGFSSDGMTMKMVGVAQTIPFPGKLAARRRAFQLDADATAIALDTVRLAVVRNVKSAYYELAYLGHALAIVQQNEKVLADVVGAAQSHYTVGTGAQSDVLKAHVAATQLGETANLLIEQQQATLAALNAALSRPTDTPVEHPDFPAWLTRAAVAQDARTIRFTANTLGAPVGGSPLPPLADLQALASEHNPEVRVHEAMIVAQAARVQLAHEEYKPDLDASIQYGQRVGLPDMVTAQ
ncbi:MAG: TolC family protein, partial [Gemmatimonadaceae bacterium]